MTAPRFMKFPGSLCVFGAVGFFILVVAVHAVGQRAGLGWPEAIYFVTGLVVLWYTIETWKLRHEMRRHDRDWKVASILKEGQHEVSITYGSLAGAWYVTTIRFADGIARIAVDEEIGVPEAEHQ
jgi:hypothetical protein